MLQSTQNGLHQIQLLNLVDLQVSQRVGVEAGLEGDVWTQIMCRDLQDIDLHLWFLGLALTHQLINYNFIRLVNEIRSWKRTNLFAGTPIQLPTPHIHERENLIVIFDL
jgi:hypothetical protein